MSTKNTFKPPQTTPFQKLAIIFSTVTFIVLSSLIASLPLNLYSHQRSMYPTVSSAGTIEDGDVAWQIVATILAILSGPTLGYLYGNIYGKSGSTLLLTSIIIGSLITFLWILISFSFVWGVDAHGNQIIGLPKSYYMFAHAGNLPSIGDQNILFTNLPTSIFAVFELSFAIITPVIVAAGVIDRVNVYGLIAFIFIWHLVFWSPIAHIVWYPSGWFKTHYIDDFSGGIVVNIAAGITVVVLNFFLDYKQAPKPEKAVPRNAEAALFATFVLWFLWFGLTAGKAHAAATVAAQSVVNTIAAVIVSILLNYFIDIMADVPYTNVQVINAILLALSAALPFTGYVTVGGALVITIITVISTRFIARTLLKDGLNDQPYSITTIHAVAGTISFLFTALISYSFVNEDAQNGLTYGKQRSIRYHLAAILALWSVAPISIALIAVFADLLVPLSRYDQSPKGDFEPVGLGPIRKSYKEDQPGQYRAPVSSADQEQTARDGDISPQDGV